MASRDEVTQMIEQRLISFQQGFTDIMATSNDAAARHNATLIQTELEKMQGIEGETRSIVLQISEAHDKQLVEIRQIMTSKQTELETLHNELVKQRGEIEASAALLTTRDAAIRSHLELKAQETTAEFAKNNAALNTIVLAAQAEHQRLSSTSAGMSSGGGDGGKGAGDSRGFKSLLDPRDYKFPSMPESCNLEVFKKWRHDALTFLEANSRWGGATQLLDQVRKTTKPIDVDEFLIIVEKTMKAPEIDDEPFVSADWEKGYFVERSKELYQLVTSKLNVNSYTDFKQNDSMNGFELWRQLNRTRDPIRKDIDFHLGIQLQQDGAEEGGQLRRHVRPDVGHREGGQELQGRHG